MDTKIYTYTYVDTIWDAWKAWPTCGMVMTHDIRLRD